MPSAWLTNTYASTTRLSYRAIPSILTRFAMVQQARTARKRRSVQSPAPNAAGDSMAYALERSRALSPCASKCQQELHQRFCVRAAVLFGEQVYSGELHRSFGWNETHNLLNQSRVRAGRCLMQRHAQPSIWATEKIHRS
jgi:hypothetical protein